MMEELNGDFLQWLRGFYFVAKTGSIRRASEHMHRNPSTISYQIRCLEHELGTVLFDRCKRSLEITPEGKKLLEWTITTFETLQSMRAEVGGNSDKLQGRTQIAATLPFASLAVNEIAKFCEMNPDVEVDIIRALNFEAQTAVRESRVDFALTGVLRLPEDESMEILFKARPLLVVRRDNPWNIPAIPTLETLRKLPMIAFLPKDALGTASQCLERLALRQTYEWKIALSVNNYHLMLRFVLQGIGVAVLDELCLKATQYGADWSPLISYPLDHILPNNLYGIFMRKNKHLTPQAKAFHDMLRNFFLKMQIESNLASAEAAPRQGRKKNAGDAKRHAAE